MGLSNIITGIVNLLTFLASIPLIGGGIWLSQKLGTECVKFLEWPMITIGVILLLVSLAGFIGAFWKIPWLLYIYLVAMFLIIVALLAFIIFAFVVTKDGPSEGKNFNLEDYTSWLQSQVRNSGNWVYIKNCIRDSKICSSLASDYPTVVALLNANLSPLQIGCCMPPTSCGFAYAGSTMWINPTNVYSGTDCSIWSNNQSQLCYDCSTCKAGVLADVKQEWKKVALLSVVVLIVLIFLYIIGCCAFRNAQTEDLFRRYEEQYRSKSWRRRNWFRNE